jgi:carbamoyl-phosphate synthase large subunit
MANILITSAGQRVSLVRAFQKELKRFYTEGKVYTVDLNPQLAPACHVSDGYKAIGRVTDANYVQQLLAICKAWDIKLIIPTIDTELAILATNKDLFLANGIIPVVSDISFVTKCRDKRIINEFFTDKGIEIPKPIEKSAPTFPLFLKPYDGSLSKDIFLIENESQLTDYHLNNEKLMFMEYINPENFDEYTVDAYYDKKGNLKCAVPRKRIFVRSGEINKGVTSNNEIVTYLESKLSHIEGAAGCLTIQFFFNSVSKRIIGIEINPRFGGGYPLSYLAGANFPKWLIEEYVLQKEIPFFNSWENNLLMLRYDDEVLVHNYEA